MLPRRGEKYRKDSLSMFASYHIPRRITREIPSFKEFSKKFRVSYTASHRLPLGREGGGFRGKRFEKGKAPRKPGTLFMLATFTCPSGKFAPKNPVIFALFQKSFTYVRMTSRLNRYCAYYSALSSLFSSCGGSAAGVSSAGASSAGISSPSFMEIFFAGRSMVLSSRIFRSSRGGTGIKAWCSK